ncbi:MAG: ATP-dependent helicase HrpB, partial [Streptosporangiaceae bacterium]
TLVPLALAGLIPGLAYPRGRVLVAEPRRIAARAAARRMAWLIEEPVGRRIGFTVRGEHRPGSSVDVVTTGVLLQRLQHDPELGGVDAVLLDECHERHLDADTALAFLLDVRATLRPDLQIIVASATTDAAPWSVLLGGAPVVSAQAVLHPVEVVWSPPPRPAAPSYGMRVDPGLLDHVTATVRRALAEHDGDVLCFLPGVGEINRVANGLDGEVLRVHGQAPPEVQEAVLTPSATRRVVLATSVAESSLTVPGVRIVVDSGLAREPRTDHARGLGSLTTVRASRAAADQRAGRAGREAPGWVYRCWPESERLAERPQPEIALADLASFALQAACWGSTDLALLDQPPAAAMEAALATLQAVGAVDAAGRATARGRRMTRIGLHPRLARALLDGADLVGGRRAAEIVALLSDQLPRGAAEDLVAVWRSMRGDHRWKEETRRLYDAVRGARGGTMRDDLAAGIVVSLAFPERVARRRTTGGHLMASGTGAAASAGLALAPWLAIAVADRPTGRADARIRQAVEIDEDIAREAAASLLTVREEVRWDGNGVVARRVESLGAIELSSHPLQSPPRELVQAALQEGLRRSGLAVLRWTDGARSLRDRLALCHRVLGPPWPAMDDEALLERAGEWLTGRDFRKIDVVAALRSLLPWPQAARLDELVPERITVPSGSQIRVDYTGDQPVLAVKLQELFGWQAAPALVDGRAPLVVHLLSPAGRPAAVTADLASFWQNGYRAVRADLRGRYPRHPWPEDPAGAVPTRRLNPRR